MEDKELEELKQASQKGTRTQAAKQELEQQEGDLVEELVTGLEAVKSGEETKMFGARDDLLAALFLVLEEREEIEDVGQQLLADLDQEPDIELSGKSAVIRLLLRVGLQESLPEYSTRLSEAAGEYAKRRM